MEFTLWFTIFFLPVVPLSSWSAVYGGEIHDGLCEDGHYFSDLVRIDRGLLPHVQTFTRSLLALALAIAPAGYLIFRTHGRAATTVEMILVFAGAAWPVGLIVFLERHRRKLLHGR